MKRNWIISITVVLFALSVLFFFGCAKKATVSDNAVQTQQAVPQKQAAAQAAPVKQPPVVDEAAQARAKAEAELKEASQLGDVYFEFDKFSLNDGAKKTINKYVEWLAAHPGFVIKIEGNCDERGTVEYNLALGERRAKAAMKYMTDLGVDKNRLATISYGKERPFDAGHSEEAWSKNRRDHFAVSAK